jgi:acyl carrier protein
MARSGVRQDPVHRSGITHDYDRNRDQGDAVSNDETFEKFKGCAVEVLQAPEDKITRDARFAEDLDADSLDLVELVMALEETFDVNVDETELEGIETIGQAYDLIVAKL